MTKNGYKIIMSVVILASLIITTQAFTASGGPEQNAGRGPGPGGRGFGRRNAIPTMPAMRPESPGQPAWRPGQIQQMPLKRILQQLNLTDEQAKQIKQIIQTSKQQAQALGDAVRQATEAMRKAVPEGADEAAIRAAANTLGNALGNRAVHRAATIASIKNVLTEEQRTQLQQLQQQIQGRLAQARQGRGLRSLRKQVPQMQQMQQMQQMRARMRNRIAEPGQSAPPEQFRPLRQGKRPAFQQPQGPVPQMQQMRARMRNRITEPGQSAPLEQFSPLRQGKRPAFQQPQGPVPQMRIQANRPDQPRVIDQKRIKQIFKNADRNADGVLSLEEAEALLNRIENQPNSPRP